MHSVMDNLNSALSLTDEERSTLTLPDIAALDVPTSQPVFALLARVLTPQNVYKPGFIDQMSGHWQGRYPVAITEYKNEEGLFHICFGCEGDKRRVLNKEPWHFQNHLIILLAPDVLQNVTKESMVYTPFWVQIYRLPFLSKSRFLAEALGNIIGEFLEVHDDSTNEGWGPFLRIRVKLLVTKPLMRGQMIKLPKIRDEFWVDFRYERLPEFCFECGCLGHPFERCVAFMERMDSGNADDDFQYGPWMKGSKLPTNGYDRYRTDFSKANAWPLLTRLARNSISPSLPTTRTRGQPQPPYLLPGESSTTPLTLHSRSNIPTSHHHQSVSTTHIPLLHTSGLRLNASGANIPSNPPQPSPSFPSTTVCITQLIDSTATMLSTQTTTSPNQSTPSTTLKQQTDPSLSTADLSNIYMPDIDYNSSTQHPPANVFATYPPMHSFQLRSPVSSQLNTHISTTPIYTTSRPTAMANVGQENTSPNVIPKRQSETMSVRKMLKRSRFLNGSSSTVSEDDACVTDVSANDNVSVKLSHFGHTFFDCSLSFEDGPSFHFTAFYGAPGTHDRLASWTLLRRLADISPLQPWLVIGDFNEILSNADKEGGPLRNERLMQDFRACLDHCHLNDTPYEGDSFTWIKNRTAATTLKERLDWCFINHLWNNVFEVPKVVHLDYYHSDHRAISAVITTPGETVQQPKRRSRFRFEKLWLADPESRDIITSCWTDQFSHSPIDNVLNNIDVCATTLQKWHIGKYGHMKKRVADAQTRVNNLNNTLNRSNTIMEELRTSESILDDLLEQEEIYWQQRSRVEWMSSGDRNTKFFHAKASARQSNNRIKFLINDAGLKVHSRSDLISVIESYFQNIFQAAPMDDDALSSVLDTIPVMVSADMNHGLTQPFTRAEVDAALQSMSPDKSPGIDGMSAMFYQQHWDLVGDLVSRAVLGVLNEGADPTPLNRTIITLIPKNKKPQSMKDYRPISLCNVISKLITKVLVARFKVVLPHVISETQSAFLPNRLITDNILVAFELVHAIKNRTAGRKGIVSLKLDMSKAFDRVEWSFIQAVMRKMGFAEQWIQLIMICLSTNTFSFNVNGEVSGSLIPTRGLRQGCPLSPYLFLICSEGLSRLLQFEEQEGRLTGFKLTRNAAPISHLLFADDSLLFCHANDSSCLAIKKVLDIYHRASGQLLNHDKSVMSFSPNTTLASQVFFHRHLSMPICECHEKYLGLPSYTGRDKQHLFSDIKEKIWRLMHNWNEKIFSAGGREVLLKAVVQAIPTYIMSCFRLPAYVGDQLESMMANFWWGSNENGSKIHWRAWNLLCKTKIDGGMGFRSFEQFNQALLAKQAWRLLEKPDSLLGKLLKSRYFPNNDFLHAPHGHSPSLTWQGIIWGRALLLKGLRWKIGEGRHIRIATDPWIPGCDTFTPTFFLGPADAMVSHLITEERVWNVPLLQQWFSPLDVDPCNIFGKAKDHHGLNMFKMQIAWGINGHALLDANMPKQRWPYGSERNRVVHGSSAKPASFLASFAVNYLSNFRSATRKYHTVSPSASPMPTSVQGAAKWTPPTGLNLKLNVDAALDANRNIVGVGAVVRNSDGHVLAAMAKPIVGNFASHIMEAQAMFHSLNWVIQLQLPISIVETDALLVANAFQFGSTAVSSYHDILLDVTSLLSFFPQVNVVHAKRSANMVAHSLAKFALGVEETCF
uniref:Reverse transcriptase domain-containing protein n=1 Tax=Cannabis sativa TaxID=3483 RepID=A0A803P614_CANSA